jgi:hypothetical protein
MKKYALMIISYVLLLSSLSMAEVFVLPDGSLVYAAKMDVNQNIKVAVATEVPMNVTDAAQAIDIANIAGFINTGANGAIYYSSNTSETTNRYGMRAGVRGSSGYFAEVGSSNGSQSALATEDINYLNKITTSTSFSFCETSSATVSVSSNTMRITGFTAVSIGTNSVITTINTNVGSGIAIPSSGIPIHSPEPIKYPIGDFNISPVQLGIGATTYITLWGVK